MKDCLGNNIELGDTIISSDMHYADLLIGEVIGFTPKKIRIKCQRTLTLEENRYFEELKYPYQILLYKKGDPNHNAET